MQQTASHVVALAYADYANPQQQCALVEEFYKADYAVFKVGLFCMKWLQLVVCPSLLINAWLI
jgi:hypothetical protein